MAGVGGGPNITGRLGDLQKLVAESQEATRQEHFESDVNQYLQTVVSSFERDTAKLHERLDDIRSALGERVAFEKFLFGGSVAKHTYVEGLSDVDALVVMDRDDLEDKSPRTVLNIFCTALRDKLKGRDVLRIEKGRLAATVVYRDEAEIQLLPAISRGRNVAIANETQQGWNEINPRAFHRQLTTANQRLNNALVPTIKIAKAIIDRFPESQRLEGHHVEALAVDAVKGYRGPRTPKALLQNFLEAAAKRVLTPIRDITGQSRVVDDYLGKANSTERGRVHGQLSAVAEKLQTAASVKGWKEIIEE